MRYSSLQDIAAKLAKLEKEWHILGPSREIIFQYRLGNQESAESLASSMSENGFECSISSGDYQWYVEASKRMEPFPANIIQYQKMLDEIAEPYDHCDGSDNYCYSEGWRYPRKEDIVFSPHSSFRTKGYQTKNQLEARNLEARQRATNQRAAVLFGSKLIEDSFARRKRRVFDGKQFVDANTTRTFDLLPSEFLRRARSSPPENPQATASAFAQWVYSLYGRASGSDEDREAGRAVEKSVWERRKETFGSVDNAFLQRIGSDWTLIHNGLQIDAKERAEYLNIEGLRVKNEPLRASPDLIYFNKKISHSLIVEIKYSRLAITNNLWPNIWAQLWCYSQIDAVSNAQRTTVVGEVWGDLEVYVNAESPLCLRASVRRDPRAPAYDRFFRSLFQIYCGEG